MTLDQFPVLAAGAAGDTPNYPLQWPVPKGYARAQPDPPTNNIIYWLVGQDKVYAGIGQVPEYDWQPALPPKGRPYPIDLRTYNVNGTGVIGLDLMYGTYGEVPDLERRTALPPKGYPYPIANRGFGLNGLALQRFYGDQGEVPGYVWQTALPPKGYPYPIEDRTFLRTGVRFIGQDLLYGTNGEVSSYRWDLPIRPGPRPVYFPQTAIRISGGDAIYGAAGQAPSYVLPIPTKGPPYPIALRAYAYDEPLRDLIRRDSFYGEQGQVPIHDYLNPRAYPFPVSLRGIDPRRPSTFPVDPGQPKTYDWPRPMLAVVRRQDFLNLSAFQLVGTDKVYGAQGQVGLYDWPVPKPYGRSIDLKTSFNSLYLFGLPKPYNIYDYPLAVPAIQRRQDYSLNTPLQLIGGDIIYGASGQAAAYDLSRRFIPKLAMAPFLHWNPGPPLTSPFVVYDYSMPRLINFAAALRDWRYVEPLTHLAGFDVVYGAGGEVPDYDWLNPRAYGRASDLRTYVNNSAETTLLGQDRFFGAIGQPPTKDWPQPVRRLSRRQPEQAPNLFYVYLAPFGPFDYPPLRSVARSGPAGSVHGTDLPILGLDRMYGASGEVPSFVLPNPYGYPYPASNRVYQYAEPVRGLIGQDRINGAPGEAPDYDWLNPRGYAYPLELRSFARDAVQSTLAGQDRMYAAPGQTPDYIWIVPAAYPNTGNWRTFVTNLSTVLFGRDIIYGAPGQVPTFVLPNPTLPLTVYRRVLDFVRNPDTQLFGLDVMYGGPGEVESFSFQIDLAPRGRPFPSSLRGRMDYDYVKVTLNPPPTRLSLQPLVVTYELVRRPIVGVNDEET